MVGNRSTANGSPSRQPHDGWDAETDFDQLDLMVAPGRGVEAVADEPTEFLRSLDVRAEAAEQLDGLLADYFSKRSAAQASRQLNQFAKTLRSSRSFPIVSGVDGLVTLQRLFASRNSKEKKVEGKIRDYIYDMSTSIGHLAVDVCTEFECGRREFYHWDVEGRMILHKRDDDQPGDPFPQVDLVLPPHLLDPDSPVNLWERKLDLKLHARGCNVRVHRVFERIDDGPLELLPADHPFYWSTPASCIDLLVASREEDGETPPTTYHELRRFLPAVLPGDAEQRPLYCLGRCGHPTIVNSGN